MRQEKAILAQLPKGDGAYIQKGWYKLFLPLEGRMLTMGGLKEAELGGDEAGAIAVTPRCDSSHVAAFDRR